jgi:hypothetical protein
MALFAAGPAAELHRSTASAEGVRVNQGTAEFLGFLALAVALPVVAALRLARPIITPLAAFAAIVGGSGALSTAAGVMYFVGLKLAVGRPEINWSESWFLGGIFGGIAGLGCGALRAVELVRRRCKAPDPESGAAPNRMNRRWVVLVLVALIVFLGVGYLYRSEVAKLFGPGTKTQFTELGGSMPGGFNRHHVHFENLSHYPDYVFYAFPDLYVYLVPGSPGTFGRYYYAAQAKRLDAAGNYRLCFKGVFLFAVPKSQTVDFEAWASVAREDSWMTTRPIYGLSAGPLVDPQLEGNPDPPKDVWTRYRVHLADGQMTLIHLETVDRAAPSLSRTMTVMAGVALTLSAVALGWCIVRRRRYLAMAAKPPPNQ